MRDYYLLRGPLGCYGDFDPPNYWWPDDRSWIDEVLATPVIDALATRPENPAHSGMDTINDPHGTVPRSP